MLFTPEEGEKVKPITDLGTPHRGLAVGRGRSISDASAKYPLGAARGGSEWADLPPGWRHAADIHIVGDKGIAR